MARFRRRGSFRRRTSSRGRRRGRKINSYRMSRGGIRM